MRRGLTNVGRERERGKERKKGNGWKEWERYEDVTVAGDSHYDWSGIITITVYWKYSILGFVFFFLLFLFFIVSFFFLYILFISERSSLLGFLFEGEWHLAILAWRLFFGSDFFLKSRYSDSKGRFGRIHEYFCSSFMLNGKTDWL